MDNKIGIEMGSTAVGALSGKSLKISGLYLSDKISETQGHDYLNPGRRKGWYRYSNNDYD